jgi:hypothetical protein
MKINLRALELIPIILGIFTSFSLNAQDIEEEEVSEEKLFFYYAALNKLTPENCILKYASTFDTDNFNLANGDEFEWKSYKEKTKKLISEGINKVNYTEKFVSVISGKFGEYSFQDHSFPIESINFQTQKTITSIIREITNNVNSYTFYINDEVINQNYFSWSLKMTEPEARSFISDRKDDRGYIDRSITLSITYSIVNRPYINDRLNEYRFVGYIYSVEIYGDNGKNLGVLYPSLDYYDKTYGVKMKEGEEIIYYEDILKASMYSNSLSLGIYGIRPSKERANYYRIIKYGNGKIIDVTDYFISGKPAIKGKYWEYCCEPRYAYGVFIWYYENGFKKQETDFGNGETEGCFYEWDDDGKCTKWMKASGNCPCKDQIKKPD